MSELPPQDLREEARRLLAPFAITDERARREVWTAWNVNPEGVERCALQAKAIGKRNGHSGAGLLVTMIRRGDHLIDPDPTMERPTGWRFVRGIDGQSGTYVEDPEGVDKLPPGYDLTTQGGVRDEREPYEVAPITDETTAELRRLARRR